MLAKCSVLVKSLSSSTSSSYSDNYSYSQIILNNMWKQNCCWNVLEYFSNPNIKNIMPKIINDAMPNTSILLKCISCKWSKIVHLIAKEIHIPSTYTSNILIQIFRIMLKWHSFDISIQTTTIWITVQILSTWWVGLWLSPSKRVRQEKASGKASHSSSCWELYAFSALSAGGFWRENKQLRQSPTKGGDYLMFTNCYTEHNNNLPKGNNVNNYWVYE